MAAHLAAIDEAFAALPSFDAAATEAALRATADARGVKAGALIHAVRVALTGRTVSPGLFEVAALVGRERTHRRLQAAIATRASALRRSGFAHCRAVASGVGAGRYAPAISLIR